MLDPRGRESVMNVIRDLRDNRGVTVLLITHNMDEVTGADRVIVLSDGKVAADGIPREVFLDVETLRGSGLDMPETALLLHELRDDGFELPAYALTVDECADAIYKALVR